MKKFKNIKIKHPSILFLVTSIGFSLIMLTLCGTTALIVNKPPDPLPSPPEKIERLLGIYTGGLEVTDPVILSVDGKEYIYLDSLVSEEWEPIDEYPLYEEYYPLEKNECERIVTNIFEKKAGEIVDCMKASSVGEWFPGPIGYYAVNSTGNIWRYKSYFAFNRLFFLFLLIGVVLGLLIAIINSTKEERETPTKKPPPNPRFT